MTKPALAEFEIQESQVEKGEVEIDYRGAVHWGLPKPEAKDEGGAIDDEAADIPLRQSHDFEPQWGVTDRWMVSFTLTATQPKGDDLEVTAVEFETQYELIEREGNGVGLAVIAAYGQATVSDEANEIEFGPIVEWAKGPLLLTSNTFFTDQVGDNADTDGLGFDYGWRADCAVAKHWGIGVEMFGEIEDLSNAGSFNDQVHSIGPTLFYNPGGNDDDVDEKIAGPAEMEFSLNVGVQFGLTDVTSDTALKFQGSLAF